MCSIVGLIGRHAVKARMRAAAIVAVKIPPNRDPSLRDALIGMQVDLLVLHRPPEPLDENVVPPGAFAVHADRDAVLSKHAKAAPVNWEP